MTHGLDEQQLQSTTDVVVIRQSQRRNSFEETSNAELKNDPKASLPSSFTICVNVLATQNNLQPILFNLLGNDGHQWFAAMIGKSGNDFIGRKFFYPGANQYAYFVTVPVFPNEWVRSCLAFDTTTGLVQWVARGEFVDNSTFGGITEPKNVPKDLSGKLILGCVYVMSSGKWVQKKY